MLPKILSYPFVLIWKILTYPILVFRVMRRRKIYQQEKKQAWLSFYSMNRKWLHAWYTDKGLDHKPPVYYDPRQKKWIKLTRKDRRNITTKKKMIIPNSKANH